jgi:histidinol-phosphatase
VTSTPAYGGEWSASLRRGSDTELRALVEEALTWCEETDEMARASFRRELEISTKPDRTLVTQVDRAIESRIRERIAAAHPAHGVLGEEEGESDAEADVRWIVDPIDGTHNFVRGIPLFGTLLAVERDGELQAGILTAPALRERWFAWRGGGAWASGSAATATGPPRRIHTSAVTRVEDAQMLYGSGTDIVDSGLAPGFGTLLRRAWRERGFGDFWSYALVAEGAAEAMVELGVNAWDLAAPLVLIEEAGGRLTDYRGTRTIRGRSVVASNGLVHDEVLAVLAGTAE